MTALRSVAPEDHAPARPSLIRLFNEYDQARSCYDQARRQTSHAAVTGSDSYDTFLERERALMGEMVAAKYRLVEAMVEADQAHANG